MSKLRHGLLSDPETQAALVQLRTRAAGRRPKGRHYLIVCEGTKTEPNYFEALRLRLAGGEADKVVVVGAQDNTLGLVDRARSEIELRNQSDDPPYYHVWLVFDRDSFPPDDFDNAILAAESEDARFNPDSADFHPHWHVAWSNEAFELWYLLHFQENSGGAIARDRYQELLSAHLGRPYMKNDPNMFLTLLPSVKAALDRADRAYRRWTTDTPWHDRNPATAVHFLVSDLLMYM